MAIRLGIEEEDPLRRTLTAPPIVQGIEEPAQPQPGRRSAHAPTEPTILTQPSPAPGQSDQRPQEPPAGGAVVSAALPPPSTPEEQNRQAAILAQQRVQQELAEDARGKVNPLSKLGQGYGKMARLLAFQRNPRMDPETGRAIADVTDVARGAIDAPISARKLELYREGTERRDKQNITTATRQEDRNRNRILRQTDLELQTGTRKIQEAVAANPTMTPGEWANLVDQSYTNLTKGIGLAQASQIMPERVRAQMTTDAEIDEANIPIYKQWLAQEGITDPAERDRLVGEMQDGGEGQARYEEFKTTEGSMAFYRTPDNKFKQQTISAAKLKAVAAARAKHAARTKLANLVEEMDPTNPAEREVLVEAGAGEPTLRIAGQLKAEPDITDAVTAEFQGEPIVVSRQPDSVTTIATRTNELLKASETLTVEQAIERAVGSAAEDGTVTLTGNTTPRQAYAALRSEVKAELSAQNNQEVKVARQQLRDQQVRQLEGLNAELGEVLNTFSPSESERVGMAVSITDAAQANDLAQEMVRERFSGLTGVSEEYLEQGLDASVESPTIAAERFKPVFDVFELVRDNILGGYRSLLAADARAERANARKLAERQAVEAVRANENAKAFLVTRFDHSGATPREVTFGGPTAEDDARAWDQADTEEREIIEAENKVRHNRQIRSTITRDSIIESFDAGMGWTGQAVLSKIETDILEAGRRLEKATTDKARESITEELNNLRLSQSYIPKEIVVLSQLDPSDRRLYLAQMERTVANLSSTPFLALSPKDRADVINRFQVEKDKTGKELDGIEADLKKHTVREYQILQQVLAGPQVDEGAQ